MSAFEIIEPELEIELAWVVFDESELCPTHWFVDPGRRAGFRIRSYGARQGEISHRRGCAGKDRGLQKFPAGEKRFVVMRVHERVLLHPHGLVKPILSL